jgi:hypothetical protein
MHIVLGLQFSKPHLDVIMTMMVLSENSEGYFDVRKE